MSVPPADNKNLTCHLFAMVDWIKFFYRKKGDSASPAIFPIDAHEG